MLKELLLDLREAEVGGDFGWIILGYAEDKKNTIKLIETGAGGRESLAAYIREEMNAGIDKILYLVIKEDDSTSKCTFLSWIGRSVGAFTKANTSTHRGAISTWMTQVVHNLQEEYVGSCAELLGLKGHDEHEETVLSGCDASVVDPNASVLEIENRLTSKPYAGKVIDTVTTKTPHQEWMDRKNAAAAGIPTPKSPSKLDATVASASGNELLSKVVLKTKGAGVKGAGRSKYAQRKSGTLDSTAGSLDGAAEGAGKMSQADLVKAAREAQEEADRLEREAAEKRARAVALVEQARQAGIEESMAAEEDETYSGEEASEPAGDETSGVLDISQPEDGSVAENRQPTSSADTTVAEVSEKVESKIPENVGDNIDAAFVAAERLQAEEVALAESAQQPFAVQEREEDSVAAAEQQDAEADDSERGPGAAARAEAEAEVAAKAEAEAAVVVKAEAEAAAQAETEAVYAAKAQAEADAAAKAQAEAEAATKAQGDAAAKAQADAAAKAEAAAKVQVEAAAKAQAAAKVQAEADAAAKAQAQAEADAAAKAEAEAATKAQAEAAAKADADAPADAYAAPKALADAEAAAIAHAEAEAAAKAQAEAEAAAEAEAEKCRNKETVSVQREQEAQLPAQEPAKPAPTAAPASAQPRPPSKSSDESDIRRRAEELLARKKALLEEAARKKKEAAGGGSASSSVGERIVGTDLNGTLNGLGGGRVGLGGDAERLKRAEEYRQRKMAELASKRSAGDEAYAAAKKAAFLREAEEAVKRDALKRIAAAEERRAKAIPTVTGSMTALLADESVESDGTPPGTPPSSK